MSDEAKEWWKDLGKELEVDIETLEDWLKPRILKYVKLVGKSLQY